LIAGVHSFNFLGLGYRVDWPVSIVVTPDALQIYAKIFSFLIQVKLAVFSLTDVWCSLKVWMPRHCVLSYFYQTASAGFKLIV
jgi:hypothetical protein